ncbi:MULTISPECIES: DUF1656 domain-containing protein [Leclercia]|uniref:DUF1656 domain-containing protein n=1 Tax=Leclercia TaxID=83654 RepID=UPI003018FA51
MSMLKILESGMLHEYAFAGLLFSPIALCSVLAIAGTLATRRFLAAMGLRRLIWAGAWFDLSLFVLILTAALFLTGV